MEEVKDTETKKEVAKEEPKRDLFSELRNKINERRAGFREALRQVKDQIEITEQNLKILEIKKNKLQGAIEGNDQSLKDVLPSNNKK